MAKLTATKSTDEAFELSLLRYRFNLSPQSVNFYD